MTRIIICPHCEREVEVTPWKDGSRAWYQCRYCGYYDTMDEDSEEQK